MSDENENTSTSDVKDVDLPEDEGKSDVDLSENEGRHMKLLRKALEKTLSKGLSAGRLSVFAKSYQPIFEANPRAVKAIHAQFVKQLQENIDDELATMYEEENIISLCNKLDTLIDEAPKDISEPMWRPSGEVAEDVRDHVVPLKVTHRERLGTYLAELERESARLQERLVKAKRKLSDTQTAVKEKTNRLNECTKVCDAKTLQQMESFIELSDS